jgi:peptide/nickel transport system substrate-binding protein
MRSKTILPLVVFLSMVVLALAACTPAPAPQAKQPSAPATSPGGSAAAPTTAPAAPAAAPTKAAAAPATQPAAPAQAQPKMGGTLVIGIEGEPNAIDPPASTNLGSTRITRQITETLIKEDTKVLGQPTAPIVGNLAEKWDISPDGKTWTFYLRKGVKFHDGTPFNAEAVKVNFDRVMDESSKYYFKAAATVTSKTTGWIKSYSVVDDSTFKIELKEPFGSFDRAIMHPNMGIVSPKALEQYGNEEIGMHLVGTGPFKFKERQRGVKVVIERNPDYWDKDNQAYVDEVVFRIMADSTARAAALKTGEIDVDSMILTDFVEDMRKDPNIDVVMPANPHIWFWRLNHLDPMLKDVRVRQAIWHAIDREGMAKALFGDTGQAAWQFLPPKNPAHRANLPNPYPYDPAKARQLLKEAGVAEGTTIIIRHPNEGSSYMRPKEMAEWVQANLKAVGLDAKLDGMEWSTWISSQTKPLSEQGVHMTGSAWQSIAHDPYMLEQLYGGQFQSPKGSNLGMYSNPEFDKLLAEARQEPNEAKRIELYHKAEDLMLKDIPGMPMANDYSPRGVRTNIKGFIMGPSTFYDLYGVWMEK